MSDTSFELNILFMKMKRLGFVSWDGLSDCQRAIMNQKKKNGRFAQKTLEDLEAGMALCLVDGVIGRLKGEFNEKAFNLHGDIMEAGKPLPDFLGRFAPLLEEAMRRNKKQ